MELVTALVIAIWALAAPAAADTPPPFLRMWGGLGNEQFHAPRSVCIDQAGSVFVSDSGNHRIQKFESSGNHVWTSGGLGSATDRFDSPEGVATDSRGNIYVADRLNSRFTKLDVAGNYLMHRGFAQPIEVAVDRNGNVFVVGTPWDAVSKYDSTGALLTQWGSTGSDNGQFRNPWGLAVDANGDVLVADRLNHRVQRFDNNGNFLATWGTLGSAAGQFNYAMDVALDSLGNVYVVDGLNRRIQTFDRDGTFIGQWGSFGSADGQFIAPSGIGIGPEGHVHVSDEYTHRVQEFSSSGDFLDALGLPLRDDQFRGSADVAVGSGGTVYVVDEAEDRILRFRHDGSYLGRWGGQGNGNGQFDQPVGITATPGGAVYVVDMSNSRIQKFDASGSFLGAWGSHGSGDGQFNVPRRLATDGSGNVYVVDRSNNRIQKFDASGNFLAKWGTWGSADGEFQGPEDVAIDWNNDVYILDAFNYRVQRFDADGNFISKWPLPLAHSSTPLGIAVDAARRIYVTEYVGLVEQFDSDGVLLEQWGQRGSDSGEFGDPGGVEVDRFGKVWVADTENHRVQVFGSEVAPALLGISDVGNDQGRQVRVTFFRSSHDAAGSITPILRYAVFRRIDGIAVSAQDPLWIPADVGAAMSGRTARSSSDPSVADAGWDFVALVPAFGQSEYSLIVPTLADSTIEHGMRWSVFFVRAATSDPLAYFDSEPDSGWSVDNLAPSIPQGLRAAAAPDGDVQLSWEASREEDLRYYNLYRGLEEDFRPTAGNRIARLTAVTFTDTGEANHLLYYKLSAVDFAGNESGFAVLRYASTPIVIEALEATRTLDRVSLRWRFSRAAWGELAGVRVQRGAAAEGPYEYLDRFTLPPAVEMSFEDRSVGAEATFWYRLELWDRSGRVSHGSPIQVPSEQETSRPIDLAVGPDGGRENPIEIRYRVARSASTVRLAVFDVRGRLVRLLETGVAARAEHVRLWDRTTDGGTRARRGVYFVHLGVGSQALSRKLVLLH